MCKLTRTKIDSLFKIIEEKKQVFILEIAKELEIPNTSVTKIARYLEQAGLVDIDYKHIKGPVIKYIKSPEADFKNQTETDLINKLKFYKSFRDIESANKLVIKLYNSLIHKGDEETRKTYEKVHKFYTDNFMKQLVDKKIVDPVTSLDKYHFEVDKMRIEVNIVKQEMEAVPFYVISLLKISDVTRLVIDSIKDEVISKITFNLVFQSHEEEYVVKKEYKQKIVTIMREVFPDLVDDVLYMFSDYIVLTSLGMGEVELLLRDKQLEEIVINSASEPIWAYHKKHGWLETNIVLDDEAKIMHFATLAGRPVDKTITTLSPLMDSHLKTGDRVNATLKPISSQGNTMTIRKFAESPWTITDFINNGTIDYVSAAIIWTAMQFELSTLIVGGTGSGKTSTLNVFSIFIPPNQRVVSIEDTRELRLPRTLHWVPLETRMANPEGKGAVTMLDLVINSLRMRPDRIIVGEIRRKNEAEVLFEAMHTGHSVYATLHANTVQEAITRLTTDPIGISKSLLSALDLIFVQNRNRRNNTRRTYQIAEMLEEGKFNMLYTYNFKKDKLEKTNPPVAFYKTLEVLAGLTKAEVNTELNDKIKVLKYLIKNKINTTEEIAMLIKNYYVNKNYIMKKIVGGKNN